MSEVGELGMEPPGAIELGSFPHSSVLVPSKALRGSLSAPQSHHLHPGGHAPRHVRPVPETYGGLGGHISLSPLVRNATGNSMCYYQVVELGLEGGPIGSRPVP